MESQHRARLIRQLHVSVFLVAFLTGLVSAHFPHDVVHVVAVSPNYPTDQTLFIATDEISSVKRGIFVLLRSTDAGATWTVMGVPNAPVADIVVSPAYGSDSTVFAAIPGHGIYRTQDGGASWSKLLSFPGISAGIVPQDSSFMAPILAISPDFGVDTTLFAANQNNEIYKSTDAGDSWVLVQDFTALSLQPIISLALSPAYSTDSTLFVGTGGDGVFKSTGGGASNWTPLGPAGSSVSRLVSPPGSAAGDLLVISTLGQGVFRSDDGGSSWTPLNTGLTNLTVNWVDIAPGFPADPTLFAATEDGVFISDSGGTLWMRSDPPRPPLYPGESMASFRIVPAPDYSVTQTVFLASHQGAWISSDGAQSWLYSEATPVRLASSLAVVAETAFNLTLFATRHGGGVSRSLDKGVTVETVNTGLSNEFPGVIEVSPQFRSDRTVMAGIWSGVEVSRDGGDSWTHKSILDQKMFVKAFAFHPFFGSTGVVFAGTDAKGRNDFLFEYQGRMISSSGAWFSIDGGETWNPTLLNLARIQSLAVSPGYLLDRTVFAAVEDPESDLDSGVYKSTSSGILWTRLATEPFPTSAAIVRLSPAYSADQTVFAGIQGGGLIKSVDGGGTWALCSGTGNWEVTAIAVSPAYSIDRTLLVGTFEEGLKKSTTGCDSWADSRTAPFVIAVAFSPRFLIDRTAFASFYDGAFRSTDGGASWTPILREVRYENATPAAVYSGSWRARTLTGASSSFVTRSETFFDTASFVFVGSQVSWVAGTGPDHGQAEVYLDSQLQDTVDLYSPTAAAQVTVWSSGTLTPGRHILEVRILDSQNPLSTGSWIDIDAFDVKE
ncbi:MAG: WD40/YVTN/BNR-like repeat-containing protein [Acidobacteriota bacterium]